MAFGLAVSGRGRATTANECTKKRDARVERVEML